MSRKSLIPPVVLVMFFSVLGVIGAVPGVAEPPPGFGVDPGSDSVEIHGFGGPTTVSIYDQPGGTYLGGGVADNGADDVVGRESHGVNIKAGMEVVADDGTTEKRLIVQVVRVKVFNVKADSVSGTAPDGPINVYVNNSTGDDCQLGATVTGGKWKVDLTVGPCILDIDYGGGAEVWVDDADGDASIGRWSPPKCNGKEATIFGTPANNSLKGTDGPDVIHGLGGNDIIKGFASNDTLCGGSGSDTINGGSGGDRIFGQEGRDTISGGSGTDVIEGGNGADILRGDDGTDTIRGGKKGDSISGGDKGDSIYGNSGADVIKGNRGPDLIRGGSGADTCTGGAGTDDISGC